MSSNPIYDRMIIKNEIAKDNYAYQQDLKNTGSKDMLAAKKHGGYAREAAGYQKEQAGRMEQMQRDLLGGIKEDQDYYRKTVGAGAGAATTQARQDLNPWRQAGTDALGQLQSKIAAGPGEFTGSPGYQFRLDEGQKAIERSAAARGGALSGAALKEGMRYGQDFATNDYDNFLRRYYESMQPFERMSGQGMQAAGQMGDFSMRGAEQAAQADLQSAMWAANARQTATNQMAEAARYGGESMAGGAMNEGNILAAQRAEQSQRENSFAAWKAGNQQARRAQYGY